MSRFWSSFVNTLQPYMPGEQPSGDKVVKLNTNENPYPPSPSVKKIIADFDVDNLRLYPDPESALLTRVIARHHLVDDENIFLGNGSDEVLAHAFNAFFRQQKPVLFPDITYSFYPVYCGLYGIDYSAVALNEDFEIDLAAYPEANGGIIFTNPNAPTGMLVSRQDIENLLERNNQTVVVIDEAYIDFSSDSAQCSAVGLIGQYPNLLVVRTLSKSRSLAGIRLGYAIGDKNLIEALNRVKNSFNSYPIDALTTAAAVASFNDDNYFRSTCTKVIANRNQLIEGIQALGFDCLPSATNFVMARHKTVEARVLYQALRDRDILVRFFDKPRLDQYLRISVGSEVEIEALIAALKAITI